MLIINSLGVCHLQIIVVTVLSISLMWIAKLLSLMKVSLIRPSTVLAPWPLSHCFGVLVKVAPCSSLYTSEDKLDYVAVIPPQISVAYDLCSL